MNHLLLHDPSALAAFFTDTVFVISENKIDTPHIQTHPQNSESELPNLKYIGNYLQKILIVVNDDRNEVSSTAGKELLKNILKHLNIGNKDFGILNIHAFENLSFLQLKQALNPALILAFGIEEHALKFDPPLTSNYERYAEIEIFKGDSLNDMADNLDMKKSFLNTLKNFQK